MPDPSPQPRLVWQGEDCLSLRWPAALDADLNQLIHRIADALRALDLPDLCDVIPAYASLALQFAPDGVPDRCAIEARVRPLLDAPPAARNGREGPGVLDVPVCYDARTGPDLDSAAQALGLSAAELVARHSAPVYQVALLGFAPGFPYLLGLDPALALPRHAQPRAEVAAGSVGIAGAQTGIYPRSSPGGWQLIGRTPWALFDPQAQPPARLRPGQRLRFRPIGFDQFCQLNESPE